MNGLPDRSRDNVNAGGSLFEEITKSVKNKDYIFLLAGDNTESLKELLKEKDIDSNIILEKDDKNKKNQDVDINDIKKAIPYILNKELINYLQKEKESLEKVVSIKSLRK